MQEVRRDDDEMPVAIGAIAREIVGAIRWKRREERDGRAAGFNGSVRTGEAGPDQGPHPAFLVSRMPAGTPEESLTRERGEGGGKSPRQLPARAGEVSAGGPARRVKGSAELSVSDTTSRRTRGTSALVVLQSSAWAHRL